MAVTKYLDKTGLSHFCSKIKAWCKATFALIGHTHSAATTSANGFLSSTDKTKLNSLTQYPRFTYTAFNFIPSNSGTNYINQNSTESVLTHLSTTQESALRFKAYKGLSLTFEQPNIQSDAQYNDFHFVVDGARLAGDGLIGSAGTLSVPEYEGATASANATSGLVPPALISERDYVLKGNGTWYNINSKANDDNVVHKTGNESIAGVKTFTDNLVMSNSKSIIFDLSASTPTVSTVRDFPIVFKSQSTAGNYTFTKYPFFEIPTTASNNYGLGVGFGASALTIIGAGESPRDIVAAEELTGTMEKLVLTSDTGIDFFVNCGTIANRIPLSITSAGTTFLYSICSTYTDRTRGDTVTSWSHKTLYFGDKYARDNKELSDAHTYGLVRSSVDASSSNLSFIAFRNTIANSSWGITITAPTDTSLPCYARLTSSPATSDNSTKIATTAYVKAQGYITGSGSITGNAATASKLGTSTIGDSSQPIYLNNGSPVECDMGAYPYKGVETSSAVLPVRWPWTDIRADSIEGFDKFTTIGRYHVNASADTFNNPTNTTMDGVLIVDATTSASFVSSYFRIKQTYLTLGSAGTHTHVYIRGAYYNSSETKWVFGAWKELSFTDHTHDTDYVKLTGDQTIAGNKTFSSRITLHGPMSGRGIEFVANTLVKGTAPSSNQAMYFYFIDKNGYSSSQNNVFGAVGISQYTNGTVAARLVGYSNDASSSTYGAVVAGVDSDGVAFATATSTSNTRTEGTDIVTRNWIPKDTRIVHTTSNETIDGIKTFSSSLIAPTPTTSDNSTKVATTAFVKAQNYITSSSNITGTATNVTGTVAIANGGTGATTRLNAIKALVNESVSTNATHFLGMKSDWSKVGYVSVADAKTVLGLGTAAYSDAGTFATSAHTHDYLPLAGGNLTGSIKLNSTNTLGIYKGNATSLTEVSGGSALNKGARIAFYGESHSSNAGRFDLIAGSTSASKSLIGKPDGTLTWGGQSVSTSSDERIKTKLQSIPENVLNAWEDVEWGEFKFLEAVADKGESARLHTGLIAQAVDRVFKAKDLDACKYGILCHEEREVTEDEPAVDLWTVRYTEALAMEAAYQRRKNKILEKRISDLEEQLASVLEILNNLKGA